MAANKDLTSDQRFSQITKDPRFWEMQEKEKKIKIDKRFRAMFHDKKFNLKYSVDKRGRPVNHNTTEDLKRYYDLSESEEEDAETALSAKKEKKKKAKQKQKEETKSKETSTKNINEKKEAETSGAMSKAEKQEKGNKLSKKKNNNEEVKRKGKPSVSVPLKSAEKSAKVTEPSESEEESGLEDESDQYSNDEISSEEEASRKELEEEEEDDGSEGEESEEDDDDEGASSGEEEDSDSGPDLARGKGNIETSSEEEDEDEDELDLPGKEIEIEHSWREMDKDAPRGDQVTRRLAVCNMDWDRLKAKDLLALFNSFKPKGGIVFSVKIYPSEFGKERLKEEELHGPTELKNVLEDVSEEQQIYKEKLREYQFKRLKYYYAVVECDTPETASKIYEECDGLEFESSCSFVDLRFVPDDVQFDDEPKDSAVDVDLSAYQPKYFTSAAVVTSKVELTWDETDQERVTTLNRPFNKKEILDMDFQAYLASSSEEEEDEEIAQETEESANPEVTKSKKSSKDDEDQIERYRQLLKGIQEKEKKQQEKDIEMEVKWVPGLKESAEQMVKNKLEGRDSLTPWEKYLQKQKDKKKLKRKKKENVEESDDEEDVPSDVDLNDPFFAEEMKKPSLDKKSAGGKKKEDQESSADDEEESEKQKAEMALLMMDDVEDDRKHFNYDKIVEHQNLSRTKKKKLKKSDKLVQDDFEINVEDSRFQAMYTSHLYNVDPSDPSFKKTKAMDKVLEEKARRREREQKNYTETVKRQQEKLETGDKTGTSARKVDPALSALLKSIKNKTQQFQASKKQKTK
ncbi:ESF1 homolog [Hyla sarda]|uniref:ESF1 homolog n=1 Tax=Hyla sarda TaxID=327740 RepID=UPI0024C2BF17|nr:ESF1 homolog [Hyla sarda]XP_056423858.1 ESF1 homolog [Hyla sarda]XP_056423859.1 ESF1 homolog [Hyla sarda]